MHVPLSGPYSLHATQSNSNVSTTSRLGAMLCGRVDFEDHFCELSEEDDDCEEGEEDNGLLVRARGSRRGMSRRTVLVERLNSDAVGEAESWGAMRAKIKFGWWKRGSTWRM